MTPPHSTDQEEPLAAQEQLDHAKQLLDLARQQTRTLVQSLPVGLFIVDHQMLVEAANPQCLVIFACASTEELLGTSISTRFQIAGNADFFKSENLAQGNCDCQEAMALRADGTSLPCELTVRPFASLQAAKFLLLVEDVTKKKEIEQLKREFVSMVSHDLRSPLTSIQCFLQAITSGVYNGDEGRLARRAGNIEADTTRLITMINSLLDLEKLEAGKLELFLDVVACGELIERSVQSLAALADHRRVTIDALLPPEDLNVMADSALIIQVLVNLLSNAVKFSPSGKSVTLKTESDGHFVTLSVSDSGPGIPEEFRKRLFNRFEQAHISDARVKGGSGLGLAFSRAIVEQHGGTIGVTSEEGVGSSFWFTLPRVIL